MANASDDRTADIAKEYGQFVAVQPIDIGGTRAFAPGDPVPASTVDNHPEWVEDGSVAKSTTKAAKVAVETGEAPKV